MDNLCPEPSFISIGGVLLPASENVVRHIVESTDIRLVDALGVVTPSPLLGEKLDLCLDASSGQIISYFLSFVGAIGFSSLPCKDVSNECDFSSGLHLPFY